MKKLKTTVLIALSSIFLTTEVIAQNIPLACQGEESAGLEWENGKWAITRFNTHKFILVKTGNSLTTESVAKASMNPFPDQITCKNNTTVILCNDMAGGAIIFNARTFKGTLALILGGTSQESKKDSVIVEVFSCTPF
jgi:hypothetical protein